MAQSKYREHPYPTDKMPPGIPYIVGNEAAERFSFYGMRAILVVFMTRYLLSANGTLSVMGEEEATGWFHLFVMAVYGFSILGAVVSDGFWGKYRTIINLSIVYCLGHAALAAGHTRWWLFLGLSLIAVGSGGIKPCVSANVGDQFGKKNEHLISRVFSWFYFAINLGSLFSTWLIPWLLEEYGPSLAFGVPGVLMFLATAVFWLGRHKYAHVPPSGAQTIKDAFSGEGLAAIRSLAPIYLCVAMFWSVYDQTGSSWVLQARRLNLQFVVEWLPAQINVVNPFLILLFIPLFTYGVYPAISKVFPLTPLRKVSIGFFLTVLAFAVPALIQMQLTGGQVVATTSSERSGNWPADRILSSRSVGAGWLSKKHPAFPQEVKIRLRERKAWAISSAAFNPHVDLKDFLAKQQKETPSKDLQATAAACEAKTIQLLASKDPDGPWKPLGAIDLKQENRLQKLEFPATEAEYVLVRVKSNFGGPYACLGAMHVNAAASAPPPAADSNAAAIWPDVAATGYQPSVGWQFLAFVLLTAAEIMISITCLEFSYTQAPKTMKSFIMALYLLSIALGNGFTAAVNFFIRNENGTSKLEGAAYFWFFTGVVFVTSLLFVVVAKTYRGKTYIQEDDTAQARNTSE